VRIEIRAVGHRWIAKTASTVSETSWRQILPLTLRAVQSEWSGDVMELFDGTQLAIDPAAEPVPFQHPGLVVYDPRTGRLAMCFGEGRWQDGFGPIRAIPIARIVVGLDRLAEVGRSLQFVGAQELTISIADAATADPAPFVDDEVDEGRPIDIGLGDAVARGVLLERTSPGLSVALGRLLPLRGKATNTYASGPLTRFWNEVGGAEGATTLEVDAGPAAASSTDDRPPQVDRPRSIAAPGYVYYMPTSPWNGLRIAARSATVMKSALPGGGRSQLVPVARLVGDWSAFSQVAANLRFTGAVPMLIRFSD
jgi:hypothetical protein